MDSLFQKIHNQPLIKRIECDRPIEELYSAFAGETDTALLNSSLRTDAGRYSYIGLYPFAVIKSKGDKLFVNDQTSTGDPLTKLNSLISGIKVENSSSLPFIAGGIGYLSYDLKDTLEELPSLAKDDLALPDMYFVFYRALVIHDRDDPGHIHLSVLESTAGEDPSAERITREIKKILFSRSGNSYIPEKHRVWPDPVSNFSKNEYINSIKRCLDHIRAGDIYQLCLSQRFEANTDIPPFELYRKLNSINPAPFSSYLNFRDARIISSSPEMFLNVRGGQVETRPMKGTRPRGESRERDKELREELLKSVKDAAELLMIVDLERNDLGRISEPGSVKTEELRRLESYPTVFQTIARVTGKLSAGTTLTDIIRATFPGGSITGCPKIRAMEIIERLEPTKRSVYCGAIGFMSFHATMQLNIAIRTMLMKGEKVYFQVGSGIVSDSDPEAEYRETLDKASALFRALYGSTRFTRSP